MKKLFALLIAVLMIATLAACSDEGGEIVKGGDGDDEEIVTSYVDAKTGDTFHFESVTSDTVVITDFEAGIDTAHEVKIPAYLANKMVIGIEEEAFATISSVSKIVFPTLDEYRYITTVTFDENGAPTETTVESEIYDPEKFEFTIAAFAFRNCDALVSIEIPAYVTAIGEGAFYECVSLESVTIASDAKLSTIERVTFAKCNKLTSITIPASIKMVNAAAFFSCDGLQTVSFAEGTVMILEQAFQNCKKLETVALPATLISIGSNAFAGTDALTTVTYAGTSEQVLSYIDGLDLPQ